MTTHQNMVDDVRAIFGDVAEVQVTDDDFIRWFNDAYIKIAQNSELLVGTDTPILTAGVKEYSLPADFLKFYRVTWDGNPLLRSTSSEMDQNYGGYLPEFSGTPTRYYFKTGFPAKILLFPTPDVVSAGLLVVEYIKRPTLIAALSEGTPFPEHILPAVKKFLLSKCYELDENWQQSARLEQEFFSEIRYQQNEAAHPFTDSYPAVKDVGD